MWPLYHSEHLFYAVWSCLYILFFLNLDCWLPFEIDKKNTTKKGCWSKIFIRLSLFLAPILSFRVWANSRFSGSVKVSLMFSYLSISYFLPLSYCTLTVISLCKCNTHQIHYIPSCLLLDKGATLSFQSPWK